MNEKKFEAGSIRQTYSRLKEEGYYISEKMLRDLIKKKEIPAGHVGKKAIVLYSNVIHYIENMVA